MVKHAPGWMVAFFETGSARTVDVPPILASPVPARAQQPTEAPIHVQSVTPVLFAEEIEPCLPFWTEGLGFQVTNQVPEGDRLGFVILERSGIEVMLQTRASVAKDLPALEDEVMAGPATLFLQVESVDEAEESLAPYGAEVVVARRRTFYGADELFVRSPCGTLVGLAAFEDDEG